MRDTRQPTDRPPYSSAEHFYNLGAPGPPELARPPAIPRPPALPKGL